MTISVMHYCVKAQILFFAPSHGGRQAVPIGDGFAPYIRAKMLAEDLPVRINGMPVKNGQFESQYEVEIELMYYSKLDYSSLLSGTEFELIEGVRPIGAGEIISPIYAR